ncbi:galactosyltransferase-related protein [Sphingobacterium sp. lm-10]|uniref:glycosyltransferase family 2 protein n=1 Tax=Sphingobacterium sp. lm-10 TaxID=2944904 RepID=UPI0020228587|nr:galactosyltransferase-related protein [Sphingobacterium sp. lm-10]MCL7986927.1 galactosyltransferase-related protein [Sphingobacterium sp. lm-10]
MSKSANNLAILTLVHKREKALINMLNGIAAGSLWPSEVLVVFMNEEALALDVKFPFPVRSIMLETKTGLNLSAARNLAMQESSANHNVFLDVDCIPDEEFLKTYHDHFVQNDGVLYTGRVGYLPKGFDEQENWLTHMSEISAPDPVRNALKSYPYELFWSLNFGCSKEVFSRIGGFDMQYEGYGAEDTDFAFQARKNNVALHTIDAHAYHQYHTSYQPPINHLKSITINASHFFAKWDTWPMEGWIKAFEDLGYIKRTDGALEIIALPTQQEIDAALK